MLPSVARILTDDEMAAVACGAHLGPDGLEPGFRLAQMRAAEVAAPDRRRLLGSLLAGDDRSDDAEAERVLGLRLADHHWAAVLRAEPGAGLDVEDLVRFAPAVVRQVGGARPLVALGHGAEVWVWTSWEHPPRPQALAAACSRLLLPVGLRIGAGPIAAGAAGFRRSLLGARAAEEAGSREADREADREVDRAVDRAVDREPGCRWCHYEDIPPVSLLTGDEERARWFVDEVLGELGRDEPWYATLRETLRLYLARGRSRQQVAAALFINRNTVAYRVRKASQLLGRPMDEDAFDVRLALEIAKNI
jgi:hypothetical protein